MKRAVFILCLMFFAAPVFALDGYDWQNNSYIEIDGNNTVKEGDDIEVYDYKRSEYKTYEVESISDDEIEVYDWRTGEYRTFDIE